MPSRSMRLLQLPNDLLLRVLRALAQDGGVQKAANLRDLWHVMGTCTRLRAIMGQVLITLRPTHMVMEEGVPHDVVTAAPMDVVQGALFSLLCRGRAALRMLRSVRLSAMARGHLMRALDLLRECTSLTELWFVDAAQGVVVPEEVARRVQTLSIVWVHTRTLKSIFTAGCAPKRLRLCCVAVETEEYLHEAWEYITRESIRADVTYSGIVYPGFHESGHDLYQMIEEADWEEMRIYIQMRSAPRGPQLALSMRTQGEEQFGWATVNIKIWVGDRRSEWVLRTLGRPQRRVEIGAEEGLLTVVMDDLSTAQALVQDNCALLNRFVQDMVVGGDGRVEKLHISVPPFYLSKNTRAMAKIAATLAVAATEEGSIGELVVSAMVFMALADVTLPPTVSSVGVVDDFAWIDLVLALPETLGLLARSNASGVAERLGVRSVWMQNMQLRDGGDGSRTDMLLRRAEAACRSAEVRGLCTTGVRGAMEQWRREGA